MIITGSSCRLLQGFSRTLILIPIISIITFLNPNKRLQYLGIIESINGFGNIISPFVGSVLYSFFGFLYMFLIIGLIHLLFIPLIKLTKHNEVEISNVNDYKVKEIEAISNSEPKLSY